VLTVQFELRARLAYDGALLGGVSRALATAVQNVYQRRFALLGRKGGQTGTVTVVQRTSSDLRLNPHYHLLALDGVYVEDGDGAHGKNAPCRIDRIDPHESTSTEAVAPTFRQLPHLTSMDVADVLQVARVRILRFLVRQGVTAGTEPGELLDDGAGDDEPSLRHLAAAAVTGQVPAGPALLMARPLTSPALHASGRP
jgi:hypothetical protein